MLITVHQTFVHVVKMLLATTSRTSMALLRPLIVACVYAFTMVRRHGWRLAGTAACTYLLRAWHANRMLRERLHSETRAAAALVAESDAFRAATLSR
jgi:hypothetical protein